MGNGTQSPPYGFGRRPRGIPVLQSNTKKWVDPARSTHRVRPQNSSQCP